MRNTLDWDFFFKQLDAGLNIDETHFYFIDDPNDDDYMLGYLPQYDKPYWAGNCDIPDGAGYYTAEELVNSKIYSGKSLRERWEQVRICGIEGICLDDWLECCEHIWD